MLKNCILIIRSVFFLLFIPNTDSVLLSLAPAATRSLLFTSVSSLSASLSVESF